MRKPSFSTVSPFIHQHRIRWVKTCCCLGYKNITHLRNLVLTLPVLKTFLQLEHISLNMNKKIAFHPLADNHFTEHCKMIDWPLHKYPVKKREFTVKIFPRPEELWIIIGLASDWKAATRFLPKKKESDNLRIMNNFHPVNTWTRKFQYLLHRIDITLETLIRPKLNIFFIINNQMQSGRSYPEKLWK